MEDLMNEMETTMDEIQYIVVKLGNEKYGIDISCVDNIVRMQHMTRVPKSQSYYVGVINLRGEVVPMRRRFGLEDDVCQSATRIIIIRMQDQSLIGVIVDEVQEVVNINPASIEKPAFKLEEEKASFLAGIGKKGEELISLLDMNAVIEEKKEV